MKNIEKYEKELRKYGVNFAINKQNVLNDCKDCSCCDCIFTANNNIKCCSKKRFDWLLSEYKEPILDDIEKEYLKGFIKPSFRKTIKYIAKWATKYDDYEWLVIGTNCKNGWGTVLTHFPPFKKGTMYKGMKTNKEYSLKDLDL